MIIPTNRCRVDMMNCPGTRTGTSTGTARRQEGARNRKTRLHSWASPCNRSGTAGYGTQRPCILPFTGRMLLHFSSRDSTCVVVEMVGQGFGCCNSPWPSPLTLIPFSLSRFSVWVLFSVLVDGGVDHGYVHGVGSQNSGNWKSELS